MKKSLSIFLSVLFILSVSTLSGAGEVSAKKNPAAGTVIKGKGVSTLYYLGEDGKRYVFPNAKTYFSWFDDFSDVEEIDAGELFAYSLGGNVRYKPGKLLVKIQTDPRVYAVGANGTLRWIKTEALARYFYGNSWNKMIDDVPDSFFTNYGIGDPIDEEGDYDPDEEEEGVPTISHNRGWKAKAIIQHRNQIRQEKRCRYLLNAVNRLQKRAELWGISLPDLGDDYLSECAAGNDSDDDDDDIATSSEKKITLCHKNKETITVAKAAVRAHLKHGDRLGVCVDEDQDDDDPDKMPPVISSVAAETGTSSASITWITDEKADSAVIYAIGSISGASTTSQASDSAKVATHTVELTGLEPATTYYYLVRSADASGNIATSSERSFATAAEPDETAPVISGIGSVASGTSAVISWATNETAAGKVIYAAESLASSTSPNAVSVPDFAISHSIELTGLATSTEYFFKIEAKDASDNVATSAESSFTTGN